METYRFYEGDFPSDYTADFEESIFNTKPHRLIQAADGWHSFYIVHEKKQQISGAIHFQISGKIANSPLKAPFGSVEFASSLPMDVLYNFFIFFEERLRAKGVSGIIIKNYPHAYETNNASLVQTFLLNLRYMIAVAEVDSVMDVHEGEVQDLFHKSHRQKFEKAVQNGLTFREIPILELKNVYAFIDQCQKAKGYQLSMNVGDMERTVSKFPGHYKLFGVFKEKELVAASVTIRVKENIVYDFYHDHSSDFDDLSPVVTLIAGIYNFCQTNAVRLLDLGTSALNGQPNFSLLHFKRCLGSRPTPKLTFEKKLD